MKRYKIEAYNSAYYGESMLSVDEHPDGEWVKYEDIKKEMARIWKDIQPPPSELLHKGA